AIDRLARRIARRRPRFARLPPRERRATVAAWRQQIALMVFGADGVAEIQDGRPLAMTLGLPEEFGALLQESQKTQWLRGTLNEDALPAVLKDPATAALSLHEYSAWVL